MESNTNSKEKLRENLVHIAAGSFSGAVASMIVQPLDVIKTRQQQVLYTNTVPSSALKELSKYRGTMDTVKIILKEEGALGLWKGTSPTLVRIIPGGGLYFLFLHNITLALSEGSDLPLSATSALIAGAVARTTASVLLLPVTVVKTRFEGFGTNYYKGVFDALKTIGQREGVKGLFSGLWPTILRDAPFSGIYYVFYNQIKHNLLSTQRLPDTLVHITSGFTAGAIATLITHPQDVIKTRLQFENSTSTRNSMSEVIKLLQKEGGAKAFYKGLFPRLIRRPLVAAITWSIYESVVKQPKKHIPTG